MNFNNSFVVQPGGVIAWILVGLIAGAIAGRLVAGRGFGCLADIAVGIAGAFVGGLLLSYFIHGSVEFFGSIIVAIIGAIVFLGVLRVFSRGRL